MLKEKKGIKTFTLAILIALHIGSAQPALELRGTVMMFPFWLGTTMYGDMWKRFSQNENRTDWWWFDKGY